MAEIKSTIDIIMERTKGLSLSQAERDELHREELIKKAKGLKLKVEADPSRTEEYFDALDVDSDRDKQEIRDLLWKMLVDAVPSDATVFKYIHFLETVPLAADKLSILSDMKHHLRNLMKDTVVDKKKLLNKERKKLAAIGISGDAVVPKLPRELPVDDRFMALVGDYKSKLT